MLIVSKHYREVDALIVLTGALDSIISSSSTEPVFFCIGSDHHLLDSFGPLTGSMIKESFPDAIVCGTLDEPLHARNLPVKVNALRRDHPSAIEIAIDASLGNADNIGMINLRQGPLLPGKAVAHRLPPLGHYSFTGVVGAYREKTGIRNREPVGLANIYHLSKTVSTAIVECCRNKTNREG
ncbi:MAG: spore protease YyaC [Deltaproteobacteria bacterium]